MVANTMHFPMAKSRETSEVVREFVQCSLDPKTMRTLERMAKKEQVTVQTLLGQVIQQGISWQSCLPAPFSGGRKGSKQLPLMDES